MAEPKEMTLGLLYVRYLMASYLYYVRDHDSPWTDHEFDAACKTLDERWDEFEHQHKYLTTREDLKSGTGFTIKDYPTIVKVSASYWYEDYARSASSEELRGRKEKTKAVTATKRARARKGLPAHRKEKTQ